MLDQQIPEKTDSPRLLRGRARSLAVAAVSIFVVLAAVGYVLAPSNPSLEMSVDELDRIPAYDQDVTAEYSLAAATVAERKRYKEIVWGALVAQGGIPVSKARLVLKGVPDKLKKYQAVITIGRPKTFRSIVRLRPGNYRFTMTLTVDGRTRSISKTQRIRNKKFYGVGVVVRESGIVTMLPINTY